MTRAFMTLAVLLGLAGPLQAQSYFPPAGGGGGSGCADPCPAEDVAAGTFGAGNFTFQNGLALGSLGTANNDDTPTFGWKLVPRPATGDNSDLLFKNELGFEFQVRATTNYTMLTSGFSGVKPMYLSAIGFSLFNLFGTKVHFQSSFTPDVNPSNAAFVIGDDDFSDPSLFATYERQVLSSFDGHRGFDDQPAGNLILSSGKQTGTGAPGYVAFATTDLSAVPGSAHSARVDRMRVTDTLQWLDTGTRPSCDADNRGKVWYDAGGAGVADTFEVCSKDASDAYAWRTLQ